MPVPNRLFALMVKQNAAITSEGMKVMSERIQVGFVLRTGFRLDCLRGWIRRQAISMLDPHALRGAVSQFHDLSRYCGGDLNWTRVRIQRSVKAE